MSITTPNPAYYLEGKGHDLILIDTLKAVAKWVNMSILLANVRDNDWETQVQWEIGGRIIDRVSHWMRAKHNNNWDMEKTLDYIGENDGVLVSDLEEFNQEVPLDLAF